MRETANTASKIPEIGMPISTPRSVGCPLLHPSQSVERDGLNTERGRKKAKARCFHVQYVWGEGGSTTLKFEPKSKTRPTTRTINKTAGVFQT